MYYYIHLKYIEIHLRIEEKDPNITLIQYNGYDSEFEGKEEG